MYILRWAIFFSLLLNSFLGAITIDRPLAKFENEYITNFDLYLARDFFFKNYTFTDKDVLNKIILVKAVIREYQRDYKAEEKLNINEFKEKLIEDYGGIENLSKQLKIYGMKLEDLEKYIRDYLFFQKIKERVLMSKVIVRFDEIENYYKNIYIPNQKKLNLKIKPLAEAAAIIEKKLKLERATKLEKFWTKEILSHYNLIFYE